MTTFPNAGPRRAAYEILKRVAEGAFADMVLDATLNRSSLDSRDKRFVTELVYGILRLQGRLDFALTQFCNQPLKRLQPEILRLLRLGAYQLLELDRVPSHAAVSETVDLARELELEKATGFVNGVLRALERGRGEIPWPSPDKIKPYLQHACSMPVWLTKEVMRQLPNSEARLLGESLAGSPPFTLRVNTLRQNRDSYLEILAAAGYRARSCRYAPEGVIIEERGDAPLPGNDEGWYQVQDEASMLIPHLLDAAPGYRILDACAAPGGKTTSLAALTDNRAEIVALDKYLQRIESIRRGSERLGCTNITTHQWDLTNSPEFLAEGDFDRVLLDAPCSGLGVLRRNPEGRWNKSAVNLRELAQLQQQLLATVAKLVRPGGKLLYSVCTFSHCETDAVVEAFLAEHQDFTCEDLRQEFPQWQELLTDSGRLRTYPHLHDGMDAFFAVRFQRCNS